MIVLARKMRSKRQHLQDVHSSSNTSVTSRHTVAWRGLIVESIVAGKRGEKRDELAAGGLGTSRKL